MQGIVTHFDPEKNYGFIRIDPRCPDFYFDGRLVNGGPVKWGAEVEFWIGDGPRGDVAVDVKRI